MTIKIISTRTSTPDYDLGHFSIDLSRKTAVLMRQSVKNADKDHYESRLIQENLIPIAMKIRRETDTTNILVYDEGAGVSGTKGYDQREKLSQLYLDIANDIVGSLLVARPDRLFRDKHFLNVDMFTQLAERKKLILIVPGKCIYDFTKYNDLKAFQKDMQDAYNYIATHVQYMHDALAQKIQRGLFGGGNLPAPYVIDANAWKDEQVPIIYTPWLEPAIDLFTRFKAFDFSLGNMGRYLESVPYIFRVPSFEETKRYMFKTRMRLVSGGYTLSHISSVRYYLSNLTLGGYAKVGIDEEGNELLLPNAFDAAIPLDLLDPAYAAITGYHIDGTPFEGKKNTKRYMRSNPQGPKALLHGLLSSDQGHINVQSVIFWGGECEYECMQGLQQQEGYTLKLRSGITTTHKLWTLSSRELDRIVLDRLCELAQHDRDMADRVKAAFDSLKGLEMDETMLLNQQIEQTQKQIHRLDFLLKDPNIPLDVETAQEYAKDLAELRPKLARLIKKQQAQPELDPEKTIADFYFVLAHLATEFQKKSIDAQKQMMSKLVKRVTVNNLSPHLFHLYIVWQDGIATRPDVALLWRGVAVKDMKGWSEEEDATLRTHWPKTPQLELMRLFPMRSWGSIRQHATALKITREGFRQGRRKVNAYSEALSYRDLEMGVQYAENGEDKAYMWEKVKELAEKTAKGEVCPYWSLPVNVVSFCDFIGDGGERPIQLRR